MRTLILLIAALHMMGPDGTPALAQEGKPKLAVMTLEDRSGDVSAELADDLTDFLRTQIARRGKFVVIDKSRQAEALKRLVGEAKKESYKACYDENCQIPLGQALSADTLLRVKLSRIGSTYQLTGEVVDLAREAVDAGAAASVEIAVEPSDGREDRLLSGIRTLAQQIAGDMPGGGGETISIDLTGGHYGITTTGGGTGDGDGIVSFDSVPAGAVVEVGGRRLPKVTPVQEFLRLGKQRVRVYGPEGYDTFDQQVDLLAGQTLRVNLRPMVGDVVVRARDAGGNLVTGVAVFLDGEEVAKAPVRVQGVREGKRSFRFEAPGMRPVDKVVEVKKNQTVEMDLSLTALSGTLRVSNLSVRDGDYVSSGLAADVFVDGTATGKTPLEVPLRPGSHEVVLRHSMAQEKAFTVEIEDGKVSTLDPELPGADTPEWRKYKSEQRRSTVQEAVSRKHVAEFTAGYLYDTGNGGGGQGYALEFLLQPESFLHRSIAIESMFEHTFYSDDSVALCFGLGLRYQYWFTFWSPYASLRTLAFRGYDQFGRSEWIEEDFWGIDVAGEAGAKLYAHPSFFLDASVGFSRYRDFYGVVGLGTNAIYPGMAAGLALLIALSALGGGSK